MWRSRRRSCAGAPAFDLKKAEERAHILEGLKRATDIVDEIIATIRACKGGQAEARAAIMEQFGFDEVQAAAICAFRLGQLAGLEILKIESELAELQGHITEWARHSGQRRKGLCHCQGGADRPQGEVWRRPPHRDRPCVR